MTTRTKVTDSATRIRSGIAVLAAFTSIAAQADTETKASSAESLALEEIIVSAQFREQKLQETPIAITAVSGAMMAERGQTNFVEIAAQAPNVVLKPGVATFGSSITASIRGVGQNDFDPAFEPGVGIYLDDVYFPTLTGALFALLDLDRVEVLRGPQGTLAGRNSAGGAIKLYSKKPDGNDEGYFAATYGARQRVDLQGATGFNLGDGIDVRLSGVHKRQEGYVDRYDFGCINPSGSALNPAPGIPNLATKAADCKVGTEGDVGYTGLRAQVRLRPSDKVDINLIGDFTEEDHTPTGTVLLAANTPNSSSILYPGTTVPYDSRFICGPYCNYSTYINPVTTSPPIVIPGVGTFPPITFAPTIGEPRTKLTNWGVSGQVNVDLTDDLKFTSITGYREYSTHFWTDDDLSPLPVLGNYGSLDFRFFSQELRLSGSALNNALNYTVGGFYSDQTSIYTARQDLRFANFAFSAPRNKTPADSKAVFAHTSYQFTDAFTLTGGVRYTKDTKSQTFIRDTIDGSGPSPAFLSIRDEVRKYKKSQVDYRLNASYQFTPSLMVYGQVATGYKGGGVSPRPNNLEQIQPFDPETVRAWEVGMKSDFLDGKARLNLAVFMNDYKKMQQTVVACPNAFGGFDFCILTVNAGDGRFKGAEAEFSINPVRGLSIDSSLSYLGFEYRRLSEQAQLSGFTKDMRPPNAPRRKASLGIQYETDLGNAGSLTPRFDIAYQSEINSNAVNTPLNRIGGYSVSNARLTWKNAAGNLDVGAEVTNLFDKYYFNNILDTSASSGVLSANPAAPREWAVKLTHRF